MQILVTGSSGSVGSVLVERLVALGHRIRPYDLRDGNDVRDRARIIEAAQDCDGIVHLAAVSRVGWGESHPELTRSINVDGTQAALRAAFAARRRPWFLFVSSCAVYGNPADAIVTEDAPIQPVNQLGRSKADGEILVERARDAELATACIRLATVYGSRRDHPDRVVPALVAQALRNEDLTLRGAANHLDFVHVDDTVAGLIAAIYLLASGEDALPPIHLATGVSTTLEALAELVAAVTGARSRIVETEARPFDVNSFCGHPGRAQRLLGWLPTVTLEQGIARLAASLKASGPLASVAMPASG